jgi:isoleucyl-tRNA synthetase
MVLNESQIIYLQMYRDKCYISSLLCEQSSLFYSMLKNILNIPTILISGIMCILNSGIFSAEELKTTNIIVNGMTTIILSLLNNFKLTETLNNFKSNQIKYTKLLHKIEDSLIQNDDELTIESIRSYIVEYDNITESVEFDYPHHIKKSIKKRFINKRSLPNILNCSTTFINKNEVNLNETDHNDVLSLSRSRNSFNENISVEIVNI